MNSHYTLQANDLLTTHYNPNVHLLLCTITNSIPTFNIFCSSQRAQALCTSGHVQPMFPLNSGTLSRSIIGAPPASVEAMISLASLSADLLTYVQLASSNIFQKRLYKGVNASSCMASVLRSNFYRRWLWRMFIARRWPTSGRYKNLETMHFRPSEALKSLKCSLEDSPQDSQCATSLSPKN